MELREFLFEPINDRSYSFAIRLGKTECCQVLKDNDLVLAS